MSIWRIYLIYTTIEWRLHQEIGCRAILHISNRQATAKAEKELETYQTKEMAQLERDFDRAIKRLAQKDEEQTDKRD